MAPLWQARPIHRMADVYAMSRWGAARESGRSRQDKNAQGARGRLGQETKQILVTPQTLRDIRHTLSFSPMRCRCTAFDTLRRLRWHAVAIFKLLPIDLAQMHSRTSSHDRLAARSRLVGSRSRAVSRRSRSRGARALTG
jgi:hypothetical protein